MHSATERTPPHKSGEASTQGSREQQGVSGAVWETVRKLICVLVWMEIEMMIVRKMEPHDRGGGVRSHVSVLSSRLLFHNQTKQVIESARSRKRNRVLEME